MKKFCDLTEKELDSMEAELLSELPNLDKDCRQQFPENGPCGLDALVELEPMFGALDKFDENEYPDNYGGFYAINFDFGSVNCRENKDGEKFISNIPSGMDDGISAGKGVERGQCIPPKDFVKVSTLFLTEISKKYGNDVKYQGSFIGKWPFERIVIIGDEIDYDKVDKFVWKTLDRLLN